MEKMKEFLARYWFVIVFIVLVFVGTYFCFIVPVGVPVGADLSKGEWLAFWGGFLSFGGATILGAIAVWQNNQANDTNHRAIEENCRMHQIDLQNELERNKILQIINGIQQILQRQYDIVQRMNTSIPIKDSDAFFSQIEMEVKLLRMMEVDHFLPTCYEKQFPELLAGKEQVKKSLAEIEDVIKEYRKIADIDNAPDIKIPITRDTLLELNSLFHEKLNAMSTYMPFDKEDS